jgi:hypothetical protein
MKTEEVWKRVVGFPGYEVSSLGGVRSYLRPKVVTMKPSVTTNGRLQVILSNAGMKQPMRVHRLVALHFLAPDIPERWHVAHNDGNPHNNAATNLRWATPVENFSDMKRHGTSQHGERSGMARLTDAAVVEMRGLFESHAVTNQYELARRFKVHPCTVRDVLRYRTWKHL